MNTPQIYFVVQLTILACCWGLERDCHIMKSLKESSATIVQCWCNSSEVRSEVMELWTMQPYHRLKSEIVHTNTIMAELDMEYTPSSFFTCGWSAKWKSKIDSIPFLKIHNFVCRFHPNETIGNCSFIDTNDWKSDEKEYMLIADGLAGVPCQKAIDEELRFVCNNITIKDSIHGLIQRHDFEIQMEYLNDLQTHKFTKLLSEMMVPNLILVGYFLTKRNNYDCVYIGTNTLFYTQHISDCQWNLRPWNPKIRLKQRILPIHSKFFDQFCLGERLNAYQTFECHYSCRFEFHNAPWSQEYIYNQTTAATLPERPPSIPPQGFYYDQEKIHLHIFWYHLDELEWNGPNFTYTVKPDNKYAFFSTTYDMIL